MCTKLLMLHFRVRSTIFRQILAVAPWVYLTCIHDWAYAGSLPHSPLGSAAVSVLPILKSSAAVRMLRKRRRPSGSTDANSVFSAT